MKSNSGIVFFILLFAVSNVTNSAVRLERPAAGRLSGEDARSGTIALDSAIIIARGWVSYSDFGARGDGKHDDQKALAEAHSFANRHVLPVKADRGATYFIDGGDLPIDVKTDTDFGDATFIIDDTQVENRNSPIFSVNSFLKPTELKNITSLKKNQKKIEVSLPGAGLIVVTDNTTKRYVRYGANQNNGSSQTDIFLVDKRGTVDKNTPVLWDFENISECTFIPSDEKTLSLSGGRFVTIANQEESKYHYYNRGMAIRRSNVVIEGLRHDVSGEGEHGAPYGGFLNIANCADVTVRNAVLTGRKVYRTIGSAGVLVSMGSYDISVNRALNVSFEYCSQTNDIHDSGYWGIMGSNYCKNLKYDHCAFSRFDAHMGVANATIRNSTLGHQGINAIGTGRFLVENCVINSRTLINLRSDYGSTWEGVMIIRDCVFKPSGLKNGNVSLIGGFNSGQHDFGYVCHMPEKITFDNLKIMDGDAPENYSGAAIFANFNSKLTDESYVEKYPYIRTREVVLRGVTTESGKPLRISDNGFMFKDVVQTWRKLKK